MSILLFGISLGVLYYIYDGYLRVLQVLGRFSGQPQVDSMPDAQVLPPLTVLLTAFNEEREIEERIRNVLDTDYPADKLQLLVASDGSTDATDQIVLGFGDRRVQLFRSGGRLGKTETQNRAMAHATGEIVVFTDAGTRFRREFLTRIAAPFAAPDVGAVDGHLIFLADPESGIATNQGYYWNYELRLRRLESRLGILAVASGACIAIRKNLFRPMNPSIGEDCILPLDVVAQGYRVVHAGDAIATDQMDRDAQGEFRARVRMTLRNWQGTWGYRPLLNPLASPSYAFALWSHKLLRWLSPFFLICLVVSANILALSDERGLGLLPAAATNGFLLLAVVGRLISGSCLRIPGASTAYSFLLANAGFFVGVLRALMGHKIHVYRTTK